MACADAGSDAGDDEGDGGQEDRDYDEGSDRRRHGLNSTCHPQSVADVTPSIARSWNLMRGGIHGSLMRG